MAGNKLLVYLLRRDLRTIDNPILHHLATFDHGFTHLLPIYIDDRDTGLSNPMSCQMYLPLIAKQENLSESALAPLYLVRRLDRYLLFLPGLYFNTPLPIPENYDDFEKRLVEPVKKVLSDPPPFPEGAKSVHPFKGVKSLLGSVSTI
ncbi:hypothetical protein FCULG_00012838 [Fusarium culmorum]|uniref:Photolyase/cryptochrome alpha/beta domain-containing protein n=1 Tax=Fusarium culmorum TaxID=5516 RepID=A0A2T4GIT6_FUSCU|nr:hypothetical protein FCULG_00012838 [Fusarium culmorum]